MSGDRILIGLIGANIMKSLSPAMHEDAFAAHGIRGHYHLMDVERLPGRSFSQIFSAVKDLGFAGVNVTFPFKQAIMPLLDEISDNAKQVGAVNTVTISSSGRTVGYNTDRSGFRLSVQATFGAGFAKGKRVVLVGAGGAGRAVAFALMDLGAAHVAINDVDAARATATAADVAAHYGAERCSTAVDAAAAIRAADGVVNATPIGMLGMSGNPVPMDTVRADHFAADVIYTPMETEFIAAARRKGCRVSTGGGMNIHQAVDAFRLFSGREPDVARMSATFARALAARDAAIAREA